MATTSIEVHTLASRAGLPCPSCDSFGLVEVDLVLADAESLAVIGRYMASECQSCGADEVTR